MEILEKVVDLGSLFSLFFTAGIIRLLVVLFLGKNL